MQVKYQLKKCASIFMCFNFVYLKGWRGRPTHWWRKWHGTYSRQVGGQIWDRSCRENKLILLTDLANSIPQDKDNKANQALEDALSVLPPRYNELIQYLRFSADSIQGFFYLFRWKNWVIRGIFTWLMIGGFGLIIYFGPLALMLTVSSRTF